MPAIVWRQGEPGDTHPFGERPDALIDGGLAHAPHEVPTFPASDEEWSGLGRMIQGKIPLEGQVGLQMELVP